MKNAGNTSKLEPFADEVRGMAEQGMTKAQVAAHYGVSHAAVRRFAAANNIEFGHAPAAKPASAARPVSSEDPTEWGDLAGLIQNRGLDPADWVIERARVNQWAEYDQLRVDLKPRTDLLQPARVDGWKAPPRVPRCTDGPQLVALFGDHHAPHHDPDLHVAVCEWLRRFKPDEWIVLGDLLDLDAVSRHRRNPAHATTAQQCVDAGYSILRSYVKASPNSRRRMVRGNHEDRLRNNTLDQQPGIHGVTQGRGPDEPEREPVLSIAHLLRLDELDVDLGDERGEYAHDQVQITPELAARHGWIARKGSGASALATIDHLRYSVVIGHTHRQSLVFHTAHDINGQPRTLAGAEAGTLAKVAGGMGYAVAPDWQQGFATATIWPDGRFKIEHAHWIAGSLFWRDWRCTPDNEHALQVAA